MNRVVTWPYDKLEIAEVDDFRDIPADAEEIPEKLLADLGFLLPESATLAEIKDREMVAGNTVPPVENWERIGWADEEAKRLWLTYRKEMRDLEATDKRRYELGRRCAENAIRLATIIAVGCFRDKVAVQDVRCAIAWIRKSFDTMVGGIDRYMTVYYEFPKFCREIVDGIATEPVFDRKTFKDGKPVTQRLRFIAKRDYERKFGRNQKYGIELGRATDGLLKQQRLAFDKAGPRSPDAERGPLREGYWLLED